MEHFYQNVEGWFTFPNIYKAVVEKLEGGLIVEVGTWMGQSAAFMAVEIVNSKKPFVFHCVDTWKGSEEHKDYDVIKNDELYEKFLKNMESVKDVIVPVRKNSLEASKDYADNSIDFLFLDAAHDYENVKADLEAWYPKVKPGCIFAGHDYPYWEGVVRAVDEFCVERSYKVFLSEQSWGIKKKK